MTRSFAASLAFVVVAVVGAGSARADDALCARMKSPPVQIRVDPDPAPQPKLGTLKTDRFAQLNRCGSMRGYRLVVDIVSAGNGALQITASRPGGGGAVPTVTQPLPAQLTQASLDATIDRAMDAALKNVADDFAKAPDAVKRAVANAALPRDQLCALLRGIPLDVTLGYQLPAPAFSRAHVDEVWATCMPQNKDGYRVHIVLETIGTWTSAKDPRWEMPVAYDNLQPTVPMTQAVSDESFDVALAILAGALSVDVEAAAARKPKEDADCERVKKVPVAVTVDGDSPAFASVLTARLIKRCVVLMPPASKGDVVEAARALGVRYALRATTTVREVTTSNGILQGTKVKNWELVVVARLLATDGRIVADIHDSKHVMGISADNAAMGKDMNATGSSVPFAWSAADQIAAELAADLASPSK